MPEEVINMLNASGMFAIFFLFFFVILPFVLCIVLFFKVWIMTNDVGRILNILKERMDLEHPLVEVTETDQDAPDSKATS